MELKVKDIFALRKQGKIEEAYEAIRPIYKEHKGRFTTLCMSDETRIPAKSVERHIKVLIERNLIEHRGSKKTGGYYAK